LLKGLSGLSRPLTLERLRINLLNPAYLTPLFVSLFGSILARAMVMGQLYPFGVSYLAGICLSSPHWRRFAFGGVLLGTLLTVHGLPVLGYLASLALLFSVFSCYKKEELHWLIVPALIFGIHLLCRGSIVFFTEGEPYVWVAILFESVFIAILSMVMNTSLLALEKVKAGGFLTAEERTSLGLVVLGILSGIAGFSFFGIGLPSVISRWLVLWGAFWAGPGGGAAIGAAVGLAPSIQGVVTLGPVAYYALSGLLGGIFCSFRKVGVIVGFALANLLLSFFFAEDVVIVQSLKETAVAVGAFLFLRLPFAHETQNAQEQLTAGLEGAVDANHYYANRMEKIARLFYEIEEVLDKQHNVRPEKNEITFLFHKVTAQVCNGCSLKRICWEQDFYKTYQALLEVCTKLEAEGQIAEKDFGHELKRRCVRLRELNVALHSQLEGLKVVRAYEKRLQACHGMVNRQLLGLAKIVEDFSAEIKKGVRVDAATEAFLGQKMAEKGFEVATLRVLAHHDGESEIQILQKPCANENWCAAMVAPNVSQILDRTYVLKQRFCTEQKESGGGLCSYSLVPSRVLQVTIGQAQCPKEGVTVSGDLCSALTLPHHQFALMMCDGMGVGEEAYQESSAAVRMLEKLLLAGFAPQMAIRTVNTILLLKSPRESFAALDLVVINQINGQCDFIKIGGVPSLLFSSKGLKVVKSSSPPVGILEEVEPQVFRHALKPQDSIVMMSDGVWDNLARVEGPEDWLENLLEQVNSNDPQTLADSLLYVAKRAAGNCAADDMCVLVARLEQSSVI
jgi:stage II sporulation protein E